MLDWGVYVCLCLFLKPQDAYNIEKKIDLRKQTLSYVKAYAKVVVQLALFIGDSEDHTG